VKFTIITAAAGIRELKKHITRMTVPKKKNQKKKKEENRKKRIHRFANSTLRRIKIRFSSGRGPPVTTTRSPAAAARNAKRRKTRRIDGTLRTVMTFLLRSARRNGFRGRSIGAHRAFVT